MCCFLHCGLLLSRAPIHKEGLIKEAIRHIVWHSSTDLRSYYFIASPVSSLATTGDFECKCSRFAGEKRKMIISAAFVLRLLAGWNWMDGWIDGFIDWWMDGLFDSLVVWLSFSQHKPMKYVVLLSASQEHNACNTLVEEWFACWTSSQTNGEGLWESDGIWSVCSIEHQQKQKLFAYQAAQDRAWCQSQPPRTKPWHLHKLALSTFPRHSDAVMCQDLKPCVFHLCQILLPERDDIT